ncbi:MAG: hypothetical protein Q4Q04_05240 [Methanocorpusculum sp.]|nr:hypothetical protein [Methanocorpusculum sp.]
MIVYKLTKSRAENMALVNERIASYNESHNDEVVFAFVAGQYRLCREGGEFPAPLAVESLKHILEDGGAQWSHPYRTGTDPTRGRGIPREWLEEFLNGTPADYPDVHVISTPDSITVPEEIPLSAFRDICVCRANFAGVGALREAEVEPTYDRCLVIITVMFLVGLILVLWDCLCWKMGRVR